MFQVFGVNGNQALPVMCPAAIRTEWTSRGNARPRTVDVLDNQHVMAKPRKRGNALQDVAQVRSHTF